MNKLKREKGITLVALIITIIVLLILAVVAIRAVQGDGILQYAKKSQSEHDKGTEKEQIMLASNEWKIAKHQSGNTKTFKTFMDEKITEKTSISGNDEGPLTITMKSGNQYILKDSGELEEGWKDNGDGSYTKGDTTVKIGETTYTNAEVLAKLGIEASEYKGSYGTATGDTWTVIGFEGDKIKLVSTKNVTTTSVTLGYNDPGAIAAIPLAEGAELTEAIKLQRSVWSYNHALDTLKTVVETATKGIEGGRSITIEDLEAKEVLNITEEQKRTLSSSYGRTYRYYYEGEAETGKVYSQYLDWNEEDTEVEDTTEEGWSSRSGGSYNIFTSYDKVIDGTDANKANVVKLKNNYYNAGSFSDEQKTKFANSLAKGSYWLASPCVSCDASRARFRVRCVVSNSIDGSDLFNSRGSAYFSNFGVRAVVSI